HAQKERLFFFADVRCHDARERSAPETARGPVCFATSSGSSQPARFRREIEAIAERYRALVHWVDRRNPSPARRARSASEASTPKAAGGEVAKRASGGQGPPTKSEGSVSPPHGRALLAKRAAARSTSSVRCSYVVFITCRNRLTRSAPAFSG